MKIGIVTMGTGRYADFLDFNLSSFHKYFFPQYERQFVCLTDKKYDPPVESIVLNFPHYDWPFPTLYKPKAIFSKSKRCSLLTEILCNSFASDSFFSFWPIDVSLFTKFPPCGLGINITRCSPNV